MRFGIQKHVFDQFGFLIIDLKREIASEYIDRIISHIRRGRGRSGFASNRRCDIFPSRNHYDDIRVSDHDATRIE